MSGWGWYPARRYGPVSLKEEAVTYFEQFRIFNIVSSSKKTFCHVFRVKYFKIKPALKFLWSMTGLNCRVV